MKKIKTIFERDWEGSRKVINKQIVDISGCYATEKVDGTNVRLTIRNHTLVRLEKRRNPSKIEKKKGIVTPWYVDANEFDPQDKYLWEAARNTDLSSIEDGEWSGEAYGEKIQGNPLQIVGHKVFMFSVPEVLAAHYIGNYPTEFERMKDFLRLAKSTFNPDVGIEGLVFWKDDEPIGKIKVKDFVVGRKISPQG